MKLKYLEAKKNNFSMQASQIKCTSDIFIVWKIFRQYKKK